MLLGRLWPEVLFLVLETHLLETKIDMLILMYLGEIILPESLMTQDFYLVVTCRLKLLQLPAWQIQGVPPCVPLQVGGS